LRLTLGKSYALISILAPSAVMVEEPFCLQVETPRMARGPYVQALTRDRAEVVWRTPEPMEARLRFRVAPDGPWHDLEPSSGTFHRARIEGLLPDTEYSYEIIERTAQAESPVAGGPGFRFRTAPPPGAPFRAIAVGDSGIGTNPQLAVKRMLCGLDPRPSFFIHTGDLDYLGDLDLSVFQPYREILAGTCFFPAHGNHDPTGEDWDSAFFPPMDDPAETTTMYSLDWGSAHFTFLDTEIELAPGSERERFLGFLRADLERARAGGARWLILVFHVPLFTNGAYFLDETRALVNAALAPVVDEFSVDLVITGHDHNWQRSHPIRGGIVRDAWQDPEFLSPAGTLHVVTGGGGNFLYGRDHRSDGTLNRTFVAEHHALELEVTDAYITGRAIAPCELHSGDPCDEGVIVLDSFTIRKDRPRPPLRFIRGDSDLSGTVDIADAILVLAHLFTGGGPLECPAAADADSSGFPLDIGDPIRVLGYLFLGSAPLPPPFPECGPAPAADDAGCIRAGCPS
jgi:hypothetical protein